MPAQPKCSVWVGGVRINFDSLHRMHRNVREIFEQSSRGSQQTQLATEILVALTALDDRLALVLGSGDIRLVRSAWVLAQDPHSFRMPHRQALEAMERSGVSPSPLFSPQEAEALLRCGQRGVGVLSQ